MSRPTARGECRCTHKRTISGNQCMDCRKPIKRAASRRDGEPDYAVACTVCGAEPTVHPTELCGPCCFGEVDTLGGDW